MKLSFVWDWPVEYEYGYTWLDGLAAALKILSQKHEVKLFCCPKDDREVVIPHPYFDLNVVKNISAEVYIHKPDVILCWGDLTRPNAIPLRQLAIPMALCFAGGGVMGPTWDCFDHFFVESESYEQAFKEQGKSVSRAFGVNSELFKPIENQEKLFDVFFPATYAAWKRHSLLIDSCRREFKVCTAGHIQPTYEKEIAKMCRNSGFLTLPFCEPEIIRTLFSASKSCVITSAPNGGSQRTCLEAMAMNVPVVVTHDSKCAEYVREGGGLAVDSNWQGINHAIKYVINKPAITREYVLSKYSEQHYANALEQGCLNLLNK